MTKVRSVVKEWLPDVIHATITLVIAYGVTILYLVNTLGD